MTVIIFVPDLPDFAPLVEAVCQRPDIRLVQPKAGYWQIQSSGRLQLGRKALGLRTALWFSMLTGGYVGRLSEYTKDAMTIEEA
ncbi:hypothetical protein [Paraburkholderia kururiensis]|jgi:hypothetical protein|uniref:hypothetical protein n=1 Tax=Paraburkholderia kururiensis TaxID=984307 RepID=UPI00034C9432|nr:hypothetical protein [Paraburkholderia kururiensis]